MTDNEAMQLMRGNSKFNQARRIASGTYALIEQQVAQENLTPVEMRKLEFEAVEKILALYGIDPRQE